VKVWTGSTGSVEGKTSGFYEDDNEHSGSINCGDCLDQLKNYKLFKRDPTAWSQLHLQTELGEKTW